MVMLFEGEIKSLEIEIELIIEMMQVFLKIGIMIFVIFITVELIAN